MTSVPNIDRNPSPPLEILKDVELLPDRIGDTVYSKQWTIKTLMNLVEVCDKVHENSKNIEVPNKDVEDEINLVELDPKIEEDACALWDMSASKEVSKFLFDSGVCEVFLDIIEKTKSPRLLEIVIGILANMSTFDFLCQDIFKNSSLLHTVLLLSGTTDTPTLIQLFRLIDAALKNQQCQELWFTAFEDNPFFMANIKDILLNSLSSSVITATFQLLFTILTQNIYYCKVWNEDLFLESVFDAAEQLFKNKNCLDSFFCVFNSLYQYTPNVEKFVRKWKELKPLFYEYIITLGNEECLLDSTRLSYVFSYFDAYNTLLNSGLINQNSALADECYLTSLAKIFKAVHNLISNTQKDITKLVELDQETKEESDTFLCRVEETKGTQSVTMMSQDEFHMWNDLADIIIDTVKLLRNFVGNDNEKKILEEILNLSTPQEINGRLIL